MTQQPLEWYLGSPPPQQFFLCAIQKHWNCQSTFCGMVAIINKLINTGTSISGAKETNINWNQMTQILIYAQECWSAKHIHITTSSSNKLSSDWYQSGVTMSCMLDKWNSCIIMQGSDQPLGHCSYIKLVGKHSKWIIVVSAYHICHKPFEAASKTASAKQIQILQKQGIVNPKPRTWPDPSNQPMAKLEESSHTMHRYQWPHWWPKGRHLPPFHEDQPSIPSPP